MSNLEPFEQKRTKWQGLWYNPSNYTFTSTTLDLADLRKFKGKIRLIVRKNKFYDKDLNRPNYIFMLIDSKCEKFNPFEIEQIDEGWADCYQTPEGERLYTEDEVKQVMRGACRDGHNGYDEYDLLISDYV